MSALRVYALGEAMAELREAGGSLYSLGFGGDTLNTLVHLKRLMGAQLDAEFISAVGCDRFSTQLLDGLDVESIGHRFVAQDPDRNIGLYAVSVDHTGERSFTYWRDRSAARRFPTSAEFEAAQADPVADLVYLSGITLAVLDETGRERVMELARAAQLRGARVAFDPNYRTRLWTASDTAKHWMRQAYAIADLILTGTEDERLFDSETPGQVIETILSRHGERDIVVTDGIHRIEAHIDGVRHTVPTLDVVSVVDTTGAGDAFNAGFLSVYLVGGSPEAALAQANRLAAYVVTVRGAIPPLSEFRQHYHESA